jgi:hypothetical protein
MSSRPPEDDALDNDPADTREEALAEEDRLPWLEPIEEEDNGPSPGKLIAAVLLGLVVIGVIVGGLFWYGNRAAKSGDPEVIAAPEGSYKVRPDSPGGMQVDNQASTQVATSDGKEKTSSVNPGGERLAAAPATNGAQPRPGTAPAPAPQRPQAPAQQARLSGPTIQVGAFPSEAAANGEWARLAGRYPYLRGLQHAVQVHQRGGQTFYRLRAAGGQASALCGRLRAAGQPCMDVSE